MYIGFGFHDSSVLLQQIPTLSCCQGGPLWNNNSKVLPGRDTFWSYFEQAVPPGDALLLWPYLSGATEVMMSTSLASPLPTYSLLTPPSALLFCGIKPGPPIPQVSALTTSQLSCPCSVVQLIEICAELNTSNRRCLKAEFVAQWSGNSTGMQKMHIQIPGLNQTQQKIWTRSSCIWSDLAMWLWYAMGAMTSFLSELLTKQNCCFQKPELQMHFTI